MQSNAADVTCLCSEPARFRCWRYVDESRLLLCVGLPRRASGRISHRKKVKVTICLNVQRCWWCPACSTTGHGKMQHLLVSSFKRLSFCAWKTKCTEESLETIRVRQEHDKKAGFLSTVELLWWSEVVALASLAESRLCPHCLWRRRPTGAVSSCAQFTRCWRGSKGVQIPTACKNLCKFKICSETDFKVRCGVTRSWSSHVLPLIVFLETPPIALHVHWGFGMFWTVQERYCTLWLIWTMNASWVQVTKQLQQGHLQTYEHRLILIFMI